MSMSVEKTVLPQCWVSGAVALADQARISTWLGRWQAACPQGSVLALVSESARSDIPSLQALLREHGVQVLGAVFPALVVDGVFTSQGILLLALPERPAYRLQPDIGVGKLSELALTDFILSHSHRSGEDAAFFIFDGMLPDIASFLERIYREVGDQVRYCGANAGSESFKSIPCVFDHERVLANAALVMILPSQPEVVISHDYQLGAETVMATSAQGNRITQIDHRPALQVYQELLQREYGVVLTRENFYQHAVHFPFGILRAEGQPLVRIPVALDEQGAIYCVGELPANALLVVLRAIEPGDPATVTTLAKGLHSDLNVLFYCAGRRMHLGVQAEHELQLLSQQLGEQSVCGALSLGEIAATASGYPLFHNAALLGVPWRCA